MRAKANEIQSQASEWVVRLNSDQVTRQDREAFRAWMEANRAHAMAYAENAALFAGVSSLCEDDEARAQLLPVPETEGYSWNRRVLLYGGGGLAASLALGVTADLVMAEQLYRTKPGEQKRLKLADGSNLVINTDTVIRVRMADTERRIVLERGQAYFQVAKDSTRPFRVFVGADEVRALGTAFDIQRVGNSAHVVLEEGRVAIYRDDTRSSKLIAGAARQEIDPVHSEPQPVAVLEPGQKAVVSREAFKVERVNLEVAQAWRYGRLILDNTPLGETVNDLNRYGGAQIVLTDPSLAGIRVSGVFHTGEPHVFAESISRAFPIRIEEDTDQRIVLAPN